MEDRTLYYICLLFSVISVTALFIYSYAMEPKEMEIGDIETSNIGDEVKIRGQIKDTYSSEDGHFFFKVEDETGEISSVIFKDGFKEMGLDRDKLQPGKVVEIEGEIDTYNRKLQILPDKIVL